ncbi:hypothetical protein [Sinomicrobium soli]|uniref:hypothetical protein n=1 Tax=Sinomicrobium sp. N-1-3-6 TaxID=2219864 RepID=UPI000DCD30C7|nr:hypothetical protein [Sinomicrobium sp. N-1-3-6]RAV29125.1 hypothetical protein DN748_09370 [Sinomicrobium sp. N-1-3-6]
MNTLYLRLLLSGCFSVVVVGCSMGVATISSSGQLTTVSREEFDEQQAEQAKKRGPDMYRQLIPTAHREIWNTNYFKGSSLENIDRNSIDYNSLTSQHINRLSENPTEGTIDIKYRRSSLYTLMIADLSDEYLHYQTRYIFGSSRLPEKFNDHNIGPYQVPGKAGDPGQAEHIGNYLNSNKVAKQLVARWFNRGGDGGFNMNLVARRGEYNASDLNIKVALHSSRGKAMLKDAGEELIGNTFVVVYDFENINNDRKVALFRYSLKSSITTRAYLYRLVWNDAVAAVFYNDYWMDKNDIDPSRKAAFDASDIFKLEYIGSVVVDENSNTGIVKHSKEQLKILEKETLDWNEVSLIQDDAVIKKALNVCLNELERKYEEFRTKFPLFSGDPIAAKVGTKEGIKAGDRFEVLEQLLHEDGATGYRRVGIIKVAEEEDIWNNTTQGDWFGESSESEYTIFQGAKGKYESGMLIRQID